MPRYISYSVAVLAQYIYAGICYKLPTHTHHPTPLSPPPQKEIENQSWKQDSLSIQDYITIHLVGSTLSLFLAE